MGRKRNSNKNSSQQNNRLLKRLGAYGQKMDSNDSDNDSVLNDTASIISGGACSTMSNRPGDYDGDFDSNHSGRDSPNDFFDEDDDGSANMVDNFSIKLSMLLEELQSTKSSKDRLRLYDSLAKAFVTRFCHEEYLENRKLSLHETIECGLKRLGDEAGSAAVVLSLTMITMGNSVDCDELFQSTYGSLAKIVRDPSAKPLVRSKCATALSIGCFITDFGMEKINDIINELLSIAFSSVRGHPDSAQMSEVNAMKANCLDMFNFLSTVSDDAFIIETIRTNMAKLIRCLESSHLELRVAAGQCIVLLYENCMGQEENFILHSLHEFREKFTQLATDSQKFKSKKELRTQRSIFRQISHTIEGFDFDIETIKFGFEKLIINSWKMRCYYDTFCGVLGSGMNLHLQQNQLLRDIFDLGNVLLDPVCLAKENKMETKYLNNLNRKSRDLSRSKMRGKRGDFEY